jgi:all-trans-8'-apo-beta-carotenal 15,15'-oxygenase
VDFDKVVSGEYCRFRVNLATGEAEREVLLPHSCEFPAVHPRYVGQPYRYVYLGITETPEGKAPLQGIAKLDVETKQTQIYSFAPRGFVGEPVFVPRPGGTAEDDGWVVVMVFHAARDRSEVVVLAAQDLALVAVLPLKHHVPYGLHGCFVPELWV